MIWIVGGTSEASRLAEKLSGRDDYIITIATEEGKEFFKGANIVVGRMDTGEMTDFCIEKGIDLIVDLSHPYAKIVSENVRDVSKKLNIQYHRYVRPTTSSYENVTKVANIEDATKLISNLKGTFLFTTGSKNVPEFVAVRGENRFIFRVLPVESSIKSLRENGVEMKDIICELGPFSKEQNLLTMKEKTVDFLVTKDSGANGGTEEKLLAARELGVKVILIERESEDGESMEEILKLIERAKS